MNRQSILFWKFGFLLVFGLAAESKSTADEPLRPFTVRDSVEMSYFGTIHESSPEPSHDDGVVSSDGLHFVKMTHRGVLPEGVTEGTIWLFNAAEVQMSVNEPKRRVPKPVILARLSAAINGLAGDFNERGNILFQLMWSEDSQYLYFLGRARNENRQLFRVSIQDKTLQALSNEDQDVLTYRVSGDLIAYLAGKNVNEDEAWRSAGSDIPDIVVGTGTPLMSLLYPNFRGYDSTKPLVLDVWQIRAGMAEPLIDKTSASGTPLQITTSYPDVAFSASEINSHKLLTDELLAEYDWVSSGAQTQRSQGNIHLTVSESLNDPPVLVASDAATGRSRTIFDPNPQLAEIEFADVSVYEWQDSHGRTIRGGLVTPPGFEPGRRYPLVIQTHGFNENRFFRVGYSETSNAGRALAGRDIVVLQVAEPQPDSDKTWNHATEIGLDVYLAAIDKLSENGTIDANKVGISGYSFTGWTVATSITKAPDRFAAAVLANTDPLTFTGYYSYVDSPLHGLAENYYVGAAPVGEGLQTWIDRVPSLSSDEILAPVLFSATDAWHLIGSWDLYASLRYQRKPVELQYIRTGKHNIAKPLHKVAHQELLIDWFDFWLDGDEDSDPAKVDQYGRWRDMQKTLSKTDDESPDTQ